MVAFLAGLSLALVVGSLVEYALHRSLHSGRLRGTALWQVHLAHHRANAAQPWWREGIDYAMIALAFTPLVLTLGCLSLGLGIGFLVGSYLYAFLAGLCHAASHQQPGSPHEVHHRRPQTNFGLTTSFWDRIFRTYQG